MDTFVTSTWQWPSTFNCAFFSDHTTRSFLNPWQLSYRETFMIEQPRCLTISKYHPPPPDEVPAISHATAQVLFERVLTFTIPALSYKCLLHYPAPPSPSLPPSPPPPPPRTPLHPIWNIITPPHRLPPPSRTGGTNIPSNHIKGRAWAAPEISNTGSKSADLPSVNCENSTL